MLTTSAVAALLALQAAAGRTYETDTTVTVAPGSRLSVQNQGGEITVRAWDRNQVRVQASHSRRMSVDVRQSGAVVTVEGRAERGPGNMVDYRITVPAWMDLEVGGIYAEIDVEGVRGAVRAETVNGGIRVKGTRQVKLSSVTGEIVVEDAQGKIEVSSVSEDVRITDAQGDILVSGTSGDILLRRVQARTVEVETLSGELVYDGSILDGGHYTFLTHSGDIVLAVAEGTNATISTAVASGDVRATFPIPSSERPGRRRQTIRLGTGSASVEAETFSGDVMLLRPAELDARLRQAEERRGEREAARRRQPPDHDHQQRDSDAPPRS